MTVLHLTDCPTRLRGDLTKWLLEIASGVFVGQISARVRDEMWLRVKEHCRNGRATLVCSTNNEQRLDFRVHGDTWEPIDFDGIKLILRPSANRIKTKRSEAELGKPEGFSDASKKRSANRFSSLRMRCPENYVVLDLETTGLNPEADEIIEIGAIKMIGHERTETLNFLILTGNFIPSEISELTGITSQMVNESGIALSEALGELSLFIGNLPIVGHNIDFDKSFLHDSYARCGLPLITNRCVDTLALARRIMKDGGNYKLETLARQLGIERSNYHRSIDDCETTGILYRKLLKLMEAGSENAVL